MDNYIKQTPEFDVEFDATDKALFVTSNIQYNWLNEAYTSNWTEIEKRNLQTQTDRLIWNNWSSLIQLESSEKSLFSRKKTQFPIFFNTRLVNTTPHWTIEVNKIHKGGSVQNTIQWSIHKICISIEDSNPPQSRNNRDSFSQSMYDESNSYWGAHKEEFSNANSINNYSIGNLGIELRLKYIELLTQIINDRKQPLVPNTQFTVTS